MASVFEERVGCVMLCNGFDVIKIIGDDDYRGEASCREFATGLVIGGEGSGDYARQANEKIFL